MASPFDFSSFLPGELEPALRALTKTYINAVERLNSAYLQSPLPGVYTTAPNIIGAKNLTFDVALRALPSIRDFVAYAQLLVTVVPAISDRETLVDTLLPIASTWNKLDVSDLCIVKEKYQEIFTSYLPTLNPIVEGLKTFLSELENVDKSNPPEWFTQTLFDTLAPILSFASFRPGVEGQSTLASILGLPLKTVSTPLNRVLFPFFPVKPDPKQVIADAVRNHLINAIVDYRRLIEGLIPLFTPFAAACTSVSKEQAAVVPRIEADDPGAEPITASQCIAAWNGVKDAANAFIDYLAASPSASSGQQPTSEAADAPRSITPGDVTAAFGPPQTASETLPEMSATTGQIVANFNKILTLPFIDQLKVTDTVGTETSVASVMLTCKKKYEKLQGVTVDIVRDLNAYGLLQEVILPVVNAPDGLSLDEFLSTNLPLVMKYGKDARKIAADIQALLTEFEGWLDVLNKNLDEINKSIVENQAALDQAQKDYNAATAGAILEGILGIIFTAVAIASLVVGQGSLAISMGISAGSSFAQMIRDAVNAGKLAMVIGNLKNVIATSEKTRDQLRVVIPLFTTIITLMGTIHTVWETISSDLSDVQSQYALWNNPAYFTSSAIQGALDNWRDVIVQCEKYISIVAGGSTSYTKEYKPVHDKPRRGDEPPPPYEVAILPGYETILGQELSPADRVGRYRAVAKAVDVNRLTTALSPPDFTLGVNRSQLNSAADSYRWVASSIRDLYNDSATDAERLATTITTELIPSLNKAIQFYITFGEAQEDPFANGTSNAAMESLIKERWEQLKQGTKLAQDAETVFINFRHASQSALSTLTRHLEELNLDLAAKEATLRNLQADYNKWSWVIWWPFPPGIGAIIYVIIDSIKQTTANINRIKSDISRLSSAQARVISVHNISDDVGRTTSMLSQGWSELTTKTQELETLVQTVVITPTMVQVIRPVVEAKWKAFVSELEQW